MNPTLRKRLWKALGEKLFFPQVLRGSENLLINAFVNDENLQQMYVFTPELIAPQSVQFFDEYLKLIVDLNYDRSESSLFKQYWKFIKEELQEPGLSGFLAEQEADILDRLEAYDMTRLSHNQEVNYLQLLQIWLLYPELVCDEKRINTAVYRFLEK